MTDKQNDVNSIKTGSTESAIKGDKQRKLKIYGSIAAAFIFGAIGVYALLASHAAVYNQIYTGQTLYAGQSMTAENNTSKYTLFMQTDGNLVIYNAAGHATWNTHTAHTGSHNRLVMQTDGNLVLYSGSRALWSSHTRGVGMGIGRRSERMVIQTDGNLVIYGAKAPIWSIYTGQIYYDRTSIRTGQSLYASQVLASRNSKPGYMLIMQRDGNLVIYNAYHHAVWNTHTAHTGHHNRLTLQTDGNLVLYSGSRALWSSRTNGRGVGVAGLFETLTLNNAGKGMLISYGGSPLWSSTNIHLVNVLWTNWAASPYANPPSLAHLQAAGYRCTAVNETSEPNAYTWWDNYICAEPHSSLRFAWTDFAYNHIVGIPGVDPSSGEARISALQAYGYKYCASFNVSSEPGNYYWADNYLCQTVQRPPSNSNIPLFQLSPYPSPGQYCTAINETSDPYWPTHFLCQP